MTRSVKKLRSLLVYGRVSGSSEGMTLQIPDVAEYPRSRDMLEVQWITPQSFVLNWNHL